MLRHRRLLTFALVVAVLTSSACQPASAPQPVPSRSTSGAATATPASPTPTPEPALSEPRFPLASAIREHFTIATGEDNDRDGKPDVVAFDVIRPDTTEKVGVIANASPYNEVSKGGETLVVDKAGNPQLMPRFYDNYFVPRGYAVVSIDNLGTGRSTGCGDEYNGPRVRAAMQLVTAFLAGAGSAQDGAGKTVTATWSNGSVGMIGGSAEGTIPLSVASAGDPHLKAVVANSAMADPLPMQGYFGASAPWNMAGAGTFNATQHPRQTCTASDAALTARANASGNNPQGPYWVERRSLPSAKWTAATLLSSGQKDDVVAGAQSAAVWKGLTEFNIPRAWWLHQGGHEDPFDIDRSAWVETIHRWFDHYLLGKTGVVVAEGVRVQNADLSWTQQPDFPMPGATAHQWTIGRTLTPVAPGTALGPISVVGSAEPYNEAGDKPETNRYFRDPLTPMPERVVALSEPLTAPLSLSSSPTVTVNLRPSHANLPVAVGLIDLGAAPRPVRKGAVFGYSGPVGGKDCWGERRQTTLDTGVKIDDNPCYDKRQLTLESTPAALISRSAAAPVPTATGGGWSSVTLTLDPVQLVIPAGHRLAVVIGVNDPMSTFTEPGTLTVGTSTITVTAG